MNEYLDETVLTTDENGDQVMRYSYNLPDGKSVDAYFAEEYTAFAVDANDANSIRIVGETRPDGE